MPSALKQRLLALRLTIVFAILLLAACSKQEPPPVVSAAPVKPASVSVAPVTSVPAPDGLLSVALAKEGEAIFNQTCATCHMADGSGVPYLQPSIKGSVWISNPAPQLLLSLILRGSAILGEGAKAYENDMAPQDHLSDAEVAAVATYVRQRFAATPITRPVTPVEVAIARSRPGLP